MKRLADTVDALVSKQECGSKPYLLYQQQMTQIDTNSICLLVNLLAQVI